MSDSRLGPLIGRGRCAEVFAWQDDRVLKLFHKSTSGMAEREMEATRIANQAGAASHNWWKFDLAIPYSHLPSQSILLSNQCFL